MRMSATPESARPDTKPALVPLGGRPPSPTIRPDPAAADSDAAGNVDAPSLRITRGPETGRVFDLLPGTTTLGRGSMSDITLDDTTVSRGHAMLRRVDGRVALSDLGSLNGTYLNRQPLVGEADLVHGDEIWAGKFRLQFRGR
jgi:pSer/pThr/pTyr-binding forkhead associated (FHA) protein